ncbi:phytanoyl-CoA dioxygenase family protein [Nocardia puris]|uniref:Ectoine hydroxylase-related dioxygenase (Phytanoyl-CoA dioxygenase family) n=1 Tax=Nocardia puris TaxID=208602 RepID=A0A366DVD4_9NOCA|nr:phytanoyl-CoA dioxygenase family protein [Nocardia puris]RBO94053.1 ectoine hydroxylase-related dioxygenase (phytanoyl-CoA dioxygenase family) [Nocardia puris]
MTGNAQTPVEHVSEDVVARYRRDGYVHVPGVLSADEVAEFLAEATAQLDAQSVASWDAEDGNVMDWVVEPERVSPVLRRLALHPGITGIGARLAGRPLRLYKSELLRKKTSGSAPTPPHADAPAFPIDSAPVTLTAWVALVDVPVERGCMTFVPGSHQWPDGVPSVFEDPFQARPSLRWFPRVTVPLRAGDCTFHDARLVHSAGVNATDQTRISLTTVYMDAEAVYRPQAGAEYYDPTPDVAPGQVFDSDRYPRVGG